MIFALAAGRQVRVACAPWSDMPCPVGVKQVADDEASSGADLVDTFRAMKPAAAGRLLDEGLKRFPKFWAQTGAA